MIIIRQYFESYASRLGTAFTRYLERPWELVNRTLKLCFDPGWDSPVSTQVTLLSILPQNILVGIQDGVDSNVGKVGHQALEFEKSSLLYLP